MQTSIPSFEAVKSSWTRALISLWTVIAIIILIIAKWQSDKFLNKIAWGYFALVFVLAFVISILLYQYCKKEFKKRYSIANDFDEAFDLYLDEKDDLKKEAAAFKKEVQKDVTNALMKEID